MENSKNHKKVTLYPPPHRLNVNVLLSNITLNIGIPILFWNWYWYWYW